MTQHQRVTWARRIMFWFSLVGLFAASYLLYTYTTGSELKCLGVVHGCDIVRSSKWASLFGIPTPVFGVFFYLAIIVLSIYRAYAPHKNVRHTRLLIVLMAIAGFVESVYLTMVQRFALDAFCLWCLVSAAAATGIFIFVWIDKRLEFGVESSSKELKFAFGSLLIALLAGATGFYYLLQPSAPKPLNLSLGQGVPEKLFVPSTSTQESTPPAEEGFPIVATSTPIEGPAQAKVTLVEFYDFQCPACGVYHRLVIKPLRNKYKDKLIFAPRHFPLVEAHPQAMGAAIAGVCAQRQGKFFEFYDWLFTNQKNLTRPDLEKHAQTVGLDLSSFRICLDDVSAKNQVIYDYNAGRSFGILGTPTLIINGALIDGTPNLDSLSKLIDERL